MGPVKEDGSADEGGADTLHAAGSARFVLSTSNILIIKTWNASGALSQTGPRLNLGVVPVYVLSTNEP